METDVATRYRSRILREMNANRENPFNSPPSSTGSHGTVTQTISSIFSDPEGESTRRLNEDIARVTAPRKLPVNWEAAHRKWPEYFSKPKVSGMPIFDDNIDTRPLSAQSKENKPPVPSFKYLDDDSTRETWGGSKRKRSEMQPRADNESDLSLILSKSPATAALAKYGMSKSQRHHRAASASPKYSADKQMSGANGSHMSSARSSLTAVPPEPSYMASPDHNVTNNGRSFFMPDVSHLGDFVTGTLRFSGSMRNGVPVLVKHGKVVDQQDRPAAVSHAAVDGLEIPEDEQKIFVSMDMIRDEIVSLQEHHEKVQEYALSLQNQVESLESQLTSGGVYKPRDFKPNFGQNAQLQLEVASLQSRLEQAAKKLSTSEITNDSLAHERDRVINRLQEACDDINKLTRKLSIKDKELETSGQIRDDNDKLQREIAELRSENARLAKENKSFSSKHSPLENECEELRESLDQVEHELDAVREEVETARRDVETAQQEAAALREDNESLVRHNDKYFNDNKVLRVENKAFERRVTELRDENNKLKEEVEFLKEQFDHCRPIPKDDASTRHNDKTENMTSAFFIPDITIKKGENATTEPTDTQDLPNPNGYTTEFETQEVTGHSVANQPANAQKVAFSLPHRPAKKVEANRGSKRRSVHQATPYKAATAATFTDDDTTGLYSVGNDAEDQAVEFSVPVNGVPAAQPQFRNRSRSRSRQEKRARAVSSNAIDLDLTAATNRTFDGEVCPALTHDARKVLNDLCEHNCKNCTVCTRITAHRGTISASDMAKGKKRIIIPRPIPATERDQAEDTTMRPSQSPGHALALVIKGLEDESHHMQLEFSRLQARYNSSDKSIGRRDRISLAESIRILLKKLEVKSDQIYSLYDVLEGQKVADQAMTEEELEMTVYSITGMTIRDVTQASEQMTWEGIADA